MTAKDGAPSAAKDAPAGAAAPKAKKEKVVPAYMLPPFAKQINRTQSIYGKLLEDNTMCRVLRGASSNDVVYEPNLEAQSHAHNLGAVRRFGDIIGRVPEHKVGTRSAAQGSFPSHWRPTGAPNDSQTRPASASSGVAFHRQITRKQDVNGKLLENIAMTRFLFGNQGSGPEHYDKAYDSMMAPLWTSDRKKIGVGQHKFGKQVGRLPLHRVGTRSAANGVYPSHWEPGMGYSESIPKATNVANFGKQPGRIELHLSGMRGAPPKASLAADYVGPTNRPQSAAAILSSGGDPNATLKRRPMTADPGRPIPEGPKKHIETHSFAKQLTRDQWTSRPLRIAG